MSHLNRNGVLGLYDIRQIFLHMLFQLNINVQNALRMKKRVHANPRESF